MINPNFSSCEKTNQICGGPHACLNKKFDKKSNECKECIEEADQAIKDSTL